MFAVFHGYLKWDSRKREWKEDEWLTQIYGELQEAKEAVMGFAEGRPFDNDRELQITRYFGKNLGIFERGNELPKEDPNVVMHEWMRYAEFMLK